MQKFSIIYTDDAMYLTKRVHSNWMIFQSEFATYKASLDDFTVDDLIEFLTFEYPRRTGWPDWEMLVREFEAAQSIRTVRIDERSN